MCVCVSIRDDVRYICSSTFVAPRRERTLCLCHLHFVLAHFGYVRYSPQRHIHLTVKISETQMNVRGVPLVDREFVSSVA